MKLNKLVFIIMPFSIVMTFLYAPAEQILGDSSRILYYHVPLAWVSVLAYIISGFYSVMFLVSKKDKYIDSDVKSHISATLGTFFTILTIITGSLWAKLSWGSYWNWDPRETTIMVLLLIYIAYMSLHAMLENNENRGRICASYLLIASATVPFFIFIIPRLYGTLHPNAMFINREANIHLDSKMRVTILFTITSFTLLFIYLFDLINRIKIIEDRIRDMHYENED